MIKDEFKLEELSETGVTLLRELSPVIFNEFEVILVTFILELEIIVLT